MKKSLTLILVLCATALAASASINVSSPGSGSTVTSPAQFVVSASSSNPITAIRIYSNGVERLTKYSSSINQTVSLPLGTNNVVINAWDSAGALQQKTFSVNVVSGGGVTISSPADGATVSSPVNVIATARGSSAITAMRIYLDSNSVYAVNAGSINTSVSMSSGAHQLTVQAWDSNGNIYKRSITVNVSSGTTTSTPSNATVFSNIDQLTGWDHCDSCAGIGGNGPSTPYSMTQGRTSPSLDGRSAEFWLGGDTPYSNALWWKQLGGNSSARNFVYDLQYYVANPSAPQALEFDVNQSVNGKKYIFGTECNLRQYGTWRVWDSANVKWVDTGVKCQAPVANTWNHLIWEFRRTDDNRIQFIAVTLNGQKSYINRYFYPIAVSSSAYEINVAFQMDGNYAQTDYSVWLDKVKLTYW